MGVIILSAAAVVVWAFDPVRWHRAGVMPLSFGAAVHAYLAMAAVEELVFRGFAFQRLVDGIGAWPVQVFMGANFDLTHSAGIAAAGGLFTRRCA